MITKYEQITPAPRSETESFMLVTKHIYGVDCAAVMTPVIGSIWAAAIVEAENFDSVVEDEGAEFGVVMVSAESREGVLLELEKLCRHLNSVERVEVQGEAS